MNLVSGASGAGHVAMLLLHSDNTGDLYSFMGIAKPSAIKGYNDANVDYAYGLDVGSTINEKKKEKDISL